MLNEVLWGKLLQANHCNNLLREKCNEQHPRFHFLRLHGHCIKTEAGFILLSEHMGAV